VVAQREPPKTQIDSNKEDGLIKYHVGVDVGKDRHHVSVRDLCRDTYYKTFSVTNDRDVLKTIGYSDKDTEEILPELYKAMATELRSWKELMHQSSAKEKEPTPQLHLFAKE
jgi:hypothetical protein